MLKFPMLPNGYKKFGWIILLPSLVFGVLIVSSGLEFDWLQSRVPALVSDESLSDRVFFKVITANLTNTLTGILCITGAMMVGFSKEKTEDEYIAGIRLSSLMWAVGVNYLLLLLAFIFIYGSPFMDVMVYNMLTILLLFIARFHFILYRNSKAISNEK